jgi:hypothetical protein
MAAGADALRRGPVAQKAAPQGQPQGVAADPFSRAVVDIEIDEAGPRRGFLNADADSFRLERIRLDAHHRVGTEDIPPLLAVARGPKEGLDRPVSPIEKSLGSGANLPLPRKIQR